MEIAKRVLERGCIRWRQGSTKQLKAFNFEVQIKIWVLFSFKYQNDCPDDLRVDFGVPVTENNEDVLLKAFLAVRETLPLCCLHAWKLEPTYTGTVVTLWSLAVMLIEINLSKAGVQPVTVNTARDLKKKIKL